MGQVPGDPSRTQLSNTMIVQNDKEIQEIWDVARTITCDWVDNYVKTINFDPFTVGMLQSQEVRFQGDQPIECWMDLQLGKWPDISSINSIVKIGDPLSLLVYARDNEFQYDVSVKDCYAFAGPDYDDPNTPRLQLTDTDGCVIKDKLISQFYTAREDDNSGSTIVTYAFINAFKFPDVMDVFMTCNIEICKGDCDQKCSAESTTTEAPRRSGSTLFGEPIYTTKPTPLCNPGSTNPECNLIEPTPPPCFAGSTDPRCTTTTPRPKCFPGSKDPNCPTTPKPGNIGKQLFPFPSSCIPGTNDPNCLQHINEPEPTTIKPPTVPPTTFKPLCFTGSLDPRCPKPSTVKPVIRCPPGSRNPICPAICDEISVDPRCKPRCFPGSRDRRCPKITTTQKPTTTQPPSTTKDDCFPGSLNPNCETATKDGRFGSILFPATITTTPSTTTSEQTTRFFPLTVPFTFPTPFTTTNRPSGSILFGEPITTTKRTTFKPKLKPKTTTTKSPGRGKQLSEPKSNPEPTGKEWEGESRYHAFHSFHFQRGDGRRSRVFGQRINPKTRNRRTIRSVSEHPRPLIGKLPLKLSHSMHVVSPIDYSVTEIDEIMIPTGKPSNFICLSTLSFTGFSVVFALLITLVLIIVILYLKQRRYHSKQPEVEK